MRILFTLLLFLISPVAFSQVDSLIAFDTYTHDFGIIKEVDSKVQYKFFFTNKSKTPLVIRKIEASCGCTTGNWTKSPVLPGKRGFVCVTFDPTNRPGNFSKTITVISNCKQLPCMLRVRGRVIPRLKTVLDSYPYEFSTGIRFEYDCLAFRKIKQNSSKCIRFNFYNNTSSKINVSFNILPPCLKLIEVSRDVESHMEGYFILEFVTDSIDQLGLFYKKIDFLVNRKSEGILVEADICEDFSSLSESELVASPRISVDELCYNFGEVNSGELISRIFFISNKGESDLVIKRVYSSSKFIYTLPSYSISSQSEREINVTIPTIDMKGRQNIVVRIISNDPRRQEIKLRFIGFIK